MLDCVQSPEAFPWLLGGVVLAVVIVVLSDLFRSK